MVFGVVFIIVQSCAAMLVRFGFRLFFCFYFLFRSKCAVLFISFCCSDCRSNTCSVGDRLRSISRTLVRSPGRSAKMRGGRQRRAGRAPPVVEQ